VISKLITSLVLALTTILLTVIGVLVGTVFLYAGWNWGLVPAVGAHTVTLPVAFWLSLCFAMIGSLLKGGSASMKKND